MKTAMWTGEALFAQLMDFLPWVAYPNIAIDLAGEL
jgi:hypothetical protein